MEDKGCLMSHIFANGFGQQVNEYTTNLFLQLDGDVQVIVVLPNQVAKKLALALRAGLKEHERSTDRDIVLTEEDYRKMNAAPEDW